MQVVVNQRFIDKRSQWARLGTWGGLAILTAGFGVSFFPEYLGASWAAMIVGVSAFNYGRYNAVRWGQRPRQDEIIATYGLKGLDHRYRLLNYMPQTPGAGHVLVGPSGVYVIHVRRQDGTITNVGSRWSRKAGLGVFLRALVEGGFGNPTHDALREANSVHQYFVKAFGEEEAARIPVFPLIVFIDARARLSLREPTVPVLMLAEVRNYMRRQLKENRLSAEQLKQIDEAFGL